MRPLAALLLVLLLAPPVVAQEESHLGLYFDTGTYSFIGNIEPLVPFDVYAVLYTPDRVNAVAYELVVPGLNDYVYAYASSYGPDGGGLNFPTDGGENVGLGVCAIGYGGEPIVVAKYTFFLTPGFFFPVIFRIAANVDADPLLPQYSTCQGVLKTCAIGPWAVIDRVPVEEKSWGAVKSLYGN